MSTWTGLGPKKDSSDPKTPKPETESSNKPIFNWGFGGKNTGKEEGTPKHNDAEDDRHIRFMIGGAGRRLTKEDFLKEIQSLDPKARCEVIAGSDAPPAMKDLAKKDASEDSPGSSRLFGATGVERASGRRTAKAVGAKMARDRGARVDDHEERGQVSDSEDDGEERVVQRPKKVHAPPASNNAKMRATSHADHPSNDVPESEAERRRRVQALKGVDEVTPAQLGRGRSSSRFDDDGNGSGGDGAVEESAAERRRREAALGGGGGEDSDDDDTPRVPPPVAKSRGIRFAQSPVRG